MPGLGLTWSQAVRAVQVAKEAVDEANAARDDVARGIATRALSEPVVPEWARRAYSQKAAAARQAQRVHEAALEKRQEVADSRRAEQEKQERERMRQRVDRIPASALKGAQQ